MLAPLAPLAQRAPRAARLPVPQAAVLGCTHYPLIKKQVKEFYAEEVEVIDSSEIVAKATKAFLEFNNLLNREDHRERDRFLVSDYTVGFEQATRLFFGEAVALEKYPLWE